MSQPATSTLLDQAEALQQSQARILRDVRHLALEMRRMATEMEAHRDSLRAFMGLPPYEASPPDGGPSDV